MEQGEIILYKPDNSLSLEVRIESDTVWLTQQQIADLFGTRRQAISKHLKNIFETDELSEPSVCSILEHTAADGKTYATKFYNLDAIISVGYRVNSKNATAFRRWANTVLKDYLLKGYSISRRLNHIEDKMERKFLSYDEQIGTLTDKIDFFVRTSLPPVEGIFYEGQIFDAYVFAANLIKSAMQSICLIDNYIDESVLTLLGKRADGVSATIYTKKISRQLQLDVERYNCQYTPINIETCNHVHDRFLIIDGTVYHLGASLKDLAKKLFAFSKMGITAEQLLNHIHLNEA